MAAVAYDTHSTRRDHFNRPPQPWSGIGLPWYSDAQERRPADVYNYEAQAAAADLAETLRAKPDAFWLLRSAEAQLAARFGIAVAATVRALLSECPGSASPEPGVWCVAAAAASWYDFKGKVYDALQADVLMTLDEVDQAVGGATDPGSTFTGLCVLVDQDRVAACLQDDPDDGGPYFVRARAAGPKADYRDLYTARVSKAPQPAA